MIDVAALSVLYPGASSFTLDSVTVRFAAGSFVAIMGPNGSGKSTFARCLNGLVLPTSGVVTVDGRRTDRDAPLIRRTLGVVFQNPRLQITSLTVEREIAFGLQNLGAPPEAVHRGVDEGLASSGLSRFRDRHPASLGGGELQRLALAAVLAMKPSHLVLDEVTSLLSPSSRVALLQSVQDARRNRGMTVVLITQFAEEALAAERLVVLRKGVIAFDGEPELFFRQNNTAGVHVPLRYRLRSTDDFPT